MRGAENGTWDIVGGLSVSCACGCVRALWYAQEVTT